MLVDEVTGEPRLVDFGFALDSLRTTQLTMTGQVLGTPLYMSPEQLRGEHVGSSTDLYSLGLVLYELLTGERPFRATTLMELADLLESSRPTPPHAVDSSIPPSVTAVCLYALAPVPPSGRRAPPR